MSPVTRCPAWMLPMLLLGPALLWADDGPLGGLAREMDDAIADPAYATAYNDLGVSYEALGRLERAKQTYLQCLEANPWYASAYANLAMLSERQGNFAEALVYWQRRDESGDPGDLWTQKAQERVALLTGPVTSVQPEPPPTPTPPPSKSHPELEIEAERLTNELAKAYYDLGVAYTKLRAYPKAIDAYEKSVALNPASPQAHAYLGLLYKQVRNDPDKASRHLQTYLRLNPQAADREELEALLALMQRDQPTRSSTGSSAAIWEIP